MTEYIEDINENIGFNIEINSVRHGSTLATCRPPEVIQARVYFVTINPNLKKQKFRDVLLDHPQILSDIILKSIKTTFKNLHIESYFICFEFSSIGRLHAHGMVSLQKLDNNFCVNKMYRRLNSNIGNTRIEEPKNDLNTFKYCCKDKKKHPIRSFKFGPLYSFYRDICRKENITEEIKNVPCP